MKNINNYQELLDLLAQKTNQRVLLHSCCGPCSSACLELLKTGLNVDIFYANSNIDTIKEFDKRVAEQMRIAKILNPKSQVIVHPYDNNEFNEAIKGLEHLGEKSRRCYQCYQFRMEQCAKYAHEFGYDYWTTTLSISPYKNSEWINEIGVMLSEKYQVAFIYSNFKLKDGYKLSIALSKEYNLYRQNYCGCLYSKKERGLIDE